MSQKNAIIFISLYIIVAIIGWEGWLNFGYTEAESWYARSGALLTLIGLYAELKILPQAKALANKCGNNKNSMNSLIIAKALTHVTVIHGTVVWAYGDLYYSWLKEHQMFMFVLFFIYILFFIGWLSKKDFFNAE